jgi:hypothetical protein
VSALVNKSVLLAPAVLNVPDAWVGHIPFAMWLVEVMQPTVLVELGTHSGNSYFAFCQSVVANDLPARCYAVDTWQGDEQAGYYGAEVYLAVEAYNKVHYSQFSHLLRMTFDEARDRFEDGSIDLLHIDGLHTYDAVQHDFETWLPKLSRRGIILFHDIAVRERDFGVWRLWEELSDHYPHITFEHTHGLGVLLVGENYPVALTSMLKAWQSADGKILVGQYFARLGHAADLEYQALVQADRIAKLEKELVTLKEVIADRESRMAILGEVIADRESRMAILGEVIADRESSIASMGEVTTALQAENAALYASTSWRITRPLRWCSQRLKQIMVRS